jgi:hypothetical protein
MLKRDDELRLSEDVQARYALEPECWEWKWQVTDEVQRRVCEELGFADNVEEGLDLMRSCMTLFPDDDEIKQAAHYLRHNIHVDCPLSVGESVPDLSLHCLSGEVRQLRDSLSKGCATVVFAGSHT